MSFLPLTTHDRCLVGLRCRFLRLGNRAKCLIVCLCCTLLVALILALSPIVVDDCRCPNDQQSVIKTPKYENIENPAPQTRPREHKLAVLVPFRDRFEELLTFAPYMDEFLRKQNINFEIFILNQVDGFRFNRASLINIGFKISRNECDYIAMHDVDLLPLNPDLSYRYPRAGPFHIASPKLHPRYHYATFVGGILLVKREDFETVNGMSNQYWGWGLEDDEFYVRLSQAGLNVSRPVNITTGTEYTFRHMHDKVRRKRDMAKCFNQREVTRRRDRKTGLKDVAYNIESIYSITINGAAARIINIALGCDKAATPWCDCGESGVAKKSGTNKIKSTPKKANVVGLPLEKKV